MKKWTFLKHLIISIIIVILSILGRLIVPVISLIVNYFKINQSVSIIGGADGPTAIYATITNNQNNLIMHYIVLFLILLILYIPIKLIFRKKLV